MKKLLVLGLLGLSSLLANDTTTTQRGEVITSESICLEGYKHNVIRYDGRIIAVNQKIGRGSSNVGVPIYCNGYSRSYYNSYGEPSERYYNSHNSIGTTIAAGVVAGVAGAAVANSLSNNRTGNKTVIINKKTIIKPQKTRKVRTPNKKVSKPSHQRKLYKPIKKRPSSMSSTQKRKLNTFKAKYKKRK